MRTTPGFGERIVVLGEEEVHHQPDDLTGGEVFTSRLVGEFREAADQFLVEVAHLQVRHRVGVQVDVGELGRRPCRAGRPSARRAICTSKSNLSMTSRAPGENPAM